MKRKHIILALVFLLCAALLAFGRTNPADQVVEAVPHAATPSVRAAGAETVGIAALRARTELIGAATSEHHELFGSRSMAPPLPSAAPAGAEIPPLPSEPAVPSLPFTYLGKQGADGNWEVYLTRGDETLIVRDQMVIDGSYRVDAIKPPTMTLVYLPLKLVQTIDIGSAD
ncbi:hypothetical protein [Paraburkholderia terrae]|uniref:Secretion system X translation initiation factor n=1 Tax=Paraburkholderia terrae TaxID=311230 RepID=A0A2I8F252_9BURK|nr:hypothetical protein [Paraburkholderia terrae]AUT65732.1 hypothetical protein C2L65_40255 [Paraburkholderia terrae]